jgi:2'-5' RNA ligase
VSDEPASGSAGAESRESARPESARLFVALELPPAVAESLSGWAAGPLAAIPGLRLTNRAAMHVTLCFLGSRPVAEIDSIAAACREVGETRAIALSLGDVEWLPRRRPSVVAVALGEDDDDARLAGLQTRLSAGLEAAGLYEPEPRPFFAHVTVARVRRGARVRAVELAGPEPLDFVASTVTLFRSRPQRGGSQYERLAWVELGVD